MGRYIRPIMVLNVCLQPKWIYKKGFYKNDNYRGQEGEFYELGTFAKCGVCEQCIAEKCNNWVVRNYYEEKEHEDKCFITLTYKESPIILIRKDLQKFMKRLRRYLEYHGDERKIRMFAVGEYGELNNRPHMHIIIYGWKDENAKYLDINKKGKIVMQSDIIQKVWGKGRTSYQEFNEHEIPYIALYSTPAEIFKRAYKMNAEKLKTLEKYFRNCKNFEKKDRKTYLEEIQDIRKEMNEKKAEWYIVKEFNAWSIGLGWEKFYDEYSKTKKYAWTEYIEDKEFCTPSPWVKRLANMGIYEAIEEMKRRENMTDKITDEQEEASKNFMKIVSRRKKEIEEWHDKKDKITIL